MNLFIRQRPDIHWLTNSLTTKIKKNIPAVISRPWLQSLHVS